MNKNVIGLVLLILGFIGMMVFVNGSITYGTNLNILSSEWNMVDRLVGEYNLVFYYLVTLLAFLIGIVILLVDPIKCIVSKIKK